MDSLSPMRTVRCHWLIVLPIAVLTVTGILWAVIVRTPDYETISTVTLAAPPEPPIGEAGRPEPLTDDGKTDTTPWWFGNQADIVNRVARAVSTDANRLALAAAGADPNFAIETGTGPDAFITGEAPTPEQAILTNELVAQSFVEHLDELQAGQAIDPTYYFTTLPLEEPTEPTPQFSGTIRVAIGILGLGIIVMFLLVSIAEARRISRSQSAGADSEPEEPSDQSDTETDPEEKTPKEPRGRRRPRSKRSSDKAKPEDSTATDDPYVAFPSMGARN